MSSFLLNVVSVRLTLVTLAAVSRSFSAIYMLYAFCMYILI